LLFFRSYSRQDKDRGPTEEQEEDPKKKKKKKKRRRSKRQRKRSMEGDGLVANAIRTLERSCDSGDGDSCFDLARFLMRGDQTKSVFPDVKRAAHFLKKGCNLDHPNSCRVLCSLNEVWILTRNYKLSDIENPFLAQFVDFERRSPSSFPSLPPLSRSFFRSPFLHTTDIDLPFVCPLIGPDRSLRSTKKASESGREAASRGA